jgi:transglutaminase-like putative cysteine protease
MRHTVFSLLAAICIGANAATIEQQQVIHGTDRFEFTYQATLPKITGKADVWLPIATSDRFQTVRVEDNSLPKTARDLQDNTTHNKIEYIPCTVDDSSRKFEVKYIVERHEKAPYVATEKEISRYLKPDRLVPINSRFADIAAEVTRGKTNDLARGRALYDHVLQRMKYDKSGTGWGRGDAIYACDARTGNCTDFHAYFIALARSINIPARFAIGVTIPADKQEGKIEGYHCWAEFLADGKWIPVDISEASKFPALAEYYFGHHPANRFELSVGRDLVVDPAPASGPINFLVYPLLEVNGAITQADTEFQFRRLR